MTSIFDPIATATRGLLRAFKRSISSLHKPQRTLQLHCTIAASLISFQMARVSRQLRKGFCKPLAYSLLCCIAKRSIASELFTPNAVDRAACALPVCVYLGPAQANSISYTSSTKPRREKATKSCNILTHTHPTRQKGRCLCCGEGSKVVQHFPHGDPTNHSNHVFIFSLPLRHASSS